MVITKNELFHLVDQLKLIGHTRVEEGYSSIDVQYHSDAAKLSLSTPVYKGYDYVPPSVRNALKEGPNYRHGHIKTYVALDEETFEVKLHYLGMIDRVEPLPVLELLEEFARIADEWRLYLDDQDRKDLLPVRR